MMRRRDFLHPRNLAQTAGSVVGAIDELTSLEPLLPEDEAGGEELPLLRLGWRAMATGFELLLPCDTADPLPAGRRVFDLIDELEAQMTVYRDTSDVSRINAAAFAGPVAVESRLFGLFQLAARVHADSSGAFDITAGALVKCWGFFRGPPRLPSRRDRDAALRACGMQHVVLDEEALTIRFLVPGVEVNLGSIGKGYALDRALGRLRQERPDVTAALVQGGQSSVLALGCQPGEARGWGVAVRHPWRPEQVLAQIYLKDRGLATSAATHRHLRYEGRTFGHILDPRTGWPAEGMASVTVAAPTAAEADALATAFYINGVEWVVGYCSAHPEVAAFLLPEGDSEPVVVGFRPDEIELAAGPDSG